jgi:iron(III) transport system substrate-binding protein
MLRVDPEEKPKGRGSAMRSKFILLMVVLLLLSAACSGTEDTASTTTQAGTSTTQSATTTGAGTTTSGGETTTTAPPAATGVGEVLASLAGLSREDRQAKLLEMVQAEGNTVIWYTALPADIMNGLVEAFQADTGVQVLAYRADGEDVVNRIVQEAQAGRQQADVLHLGDAQLLPIRDAGLLTPYNSPYQDDLIEGSLQELWTLSNYQVYAVSWNTELVPAGTQPTSYEDLTDPRWAGKSAVDAADYDWYWSVSNYLRDEKGYSTEQLAQYWADLAAITEFTSGHTATRQLLSAGEYDLFLSNFSNGVERDKAAGAPIDWLPPVEPLFATPEAIALCAGAVRPAAGILFADWFLSSGQQVFKDLFFDVTRTDLLTFDPTADLRFIDAEAFAKVEAQVIADYNALVAGG